MNGRMDKAGSAREDVAEQGSGRAPMGINRVELMRTFWRDEHGHLYCVRGTTGYGDDDTMVRLEWVAPERQALTYRELKRRFTRENPPRGAA